MLALMATPEKMVHTYNHTIVATQTAPLMTTGQPKETPTPTPAKKAHESQRIILLAIDGNNIIKTKGSGTGQKTL